jgi:hypothetical protein
MVDLWMIFTIIVTLLEVSLHTYKETLKDKLGQLKSPRIRSPDLFKVRPSVDGNAKAVQKQIATLELSETER